MDPIPLRKLVDVTGGRWRGPGGIPAIQVLDVSTDSRTVGAGALFVAIRGDRFDGRKFIGEALGRGALAVLAEPGGDGAFPPHSPRGDGAFPPRSPRGDGAFPPRSPRGDGDGAFPPRSRGDGVGDGEPAPIIEVPDVLVALERLAGCVRDGVGAERIAITGTVGKTTTKEFLGTLLERKGPTVRAPKSFNNRLGVSLTLLLARKGTRWIVCETGANAAGELAHLSRLVRPSRVAVTEIGHAHLAGFGDLAGVIRAKAEVFQGLLPGGRAFLNEGAPGREELADRARAAGAEVVLFGWERGDYRIVSWARLETSVLGYRFRVRDPEGREEDLVFPLPGRHNLLNALAACAMARDAGLGWDEIREGLLALHLPPLRFDVRSVGGVTVIDDTYNASRRSVLAALQEAGEMDVSPDGRRFLVLGNLLEMGESSREIHEEIGREVVRGGRFSGLIAVGGEAAHAARAAQEVSSGRTLSVSRLEKVEAVADHLHGLLAPGDLVLFKASRGVALERAAEELRRRLGVRRTVLSPHIPPEGTVTVLSPHIPPEGTVTVLSPLNPPEGTVTVLSPLNPPEGTGTVLSPHIPPEGTVSPGIGGAAGERTQVSIEPKASGAHQAPRRGRPRVVARVPSPANRRGGSGEGPPPPPTGRLGA